MSGIGEMRKELYPVKSPCAAFFDGIQAFVDGVLSVFGLVLGRRTRR